MGMTEFLLVLAVGGGIIAVLFATFRGAAADARADETPRAPAGRASGGRIELEERQAAVIASLEEIEADHEAGNLSDADYDRLRRRYEREAAAVLRRLGADGATSSAETAGEPEPAGAASSSRWPAAIGWIAAVAGFVAVAGLVMSTALRPRAGDDTITGGVPAGDAAPPVAGGALMPIDAERLAELERVVAADSNDVDALVEIGRLYLSSQRFGEVARVSLKALSLDADNPGAHTNLGMVLVSIDHVKEGLASFDRALAADPDFADALLFKGMVSFQMRDFETAIGAWERYLEVAPPDANVSRITGMLEAARAALGGQTAS